MSMLVFLPRTSEEHAVFGGTVYFEIDGRQMGTLEDHGLESQARGISVPSGRHVVRMYKSHKYGAHVGIAEREVSLAPGQRLMVQYTCPTETAAPGDMILSPYSPRMAQHALMSRDDEILRSYAEDYDREMGRINDRFGITAALVLVGLVIMVILALVNHW